MEHTQLYVTALTVTYKTHAASGAGKLHEMPAR
jgi:hypothetical protein